MSRLDRMMARAMSDEPRERWPRFQVEIPPEQADELMRLYRQTMGVNASAATRGGLLRIALLEWWQRQDPEPDAPIEGTATEIIDAPRLPEAFDLTAELEDEIGRMRRAMGEDKPR